MFVTREFRWNNLTNVLPQFQLVTHIINIFASNIFNHYPNLRNVIMG